MKRSPVSKPDTNCIVLRTCCIRPAGGAMLIDFARRLHPEASYFPYPKLEENLHLMEQISEPYPKKRVFKFLTRGYSRGTELCVQKLLLCLATHENLIRSIKSRSKDVDMDPTMRVWEIKHLDEVPCVLNKLVVDMRTSPVDYLSIEPIIDEDEKQTYWTLAGILLKSSA